MAITSHDFDNYWAKTETYKSIYTYVEMNFEWLKDKVMQLIATEKNDINPGNFQNIMTTLRSADDFFTLLVHLDYLTFGFYTN